MKRILRALGIALAMLGVTMAQATVTNWGSHDPLEVATIFAPPGEVSDKFRFTLTGPATFLTSVVVSSELSPYLGTTKGSYGLYQGLTLLSSWNFDGTTGSVVNFAGQLSAGSYYYEVVTFASGMAGAVYTITSSASPVPEPQSYAMLAAGLLAVGFLSRRRMATNTA